MYIYYLSKINQFPHPPSHYKKVWLSQLTRENYYFLNILKKYMYIKKKKLLFRN